MDITIKFPNNEEVPFEQGKPFVIIGANGSGKTRFSVRIEELNDKHYNNQKTADEDMLIHRISAQKSLNIADTIALRDYNSSQSALFYGNEKERLYKFGDRYGSNPATYLLNDYDRVLGLLFAESNKMLQEAHEADKRAEASGKARPEIITTVQEKATTIWNELLPLRNIDLTGNSVHIIKGDVSYHGKEMSDGERVMLYMICQVLVLKPNSIIIIDEPELHIHKAIVKNFWDKLELERKDCVFMYITHDLDFAASRDTDKVLWIKKFDGKNWEYEFLSSNDYSDLPQELLYELIGTHKKVLFVEGEKNSYDHALYCEYFKDKGYHIVPCGGCQEVVKVFKAKKAYEKLNSIEAHCLIDRDYRNDSEIKALEGDGVKFLKVAEVENLFIVPELLDIMEKQLGCKENTAQDAKNFIIELYGLNKPNQIKEAFLKEINHKLTLLNYEDKILTPEDIQKDIINKFTEDKITEIYNEKKNTFNDAKEINDILKIFNFKQLGKKVGKKFGIHHDFPERIIKLIKNSDGLRERILKVLGEYIPDLSN